MKKSRAKYVWVPGLIIGLAYILKSIATIVILAFFPNVNSSLTNYLTKLDGTVETGLTIIAIAISVWIGLNIYSYIDRNDFDKLRDSANSASKQLGCFIVQQKLDLLKEIRDFNVFGDGSLIVLYKVLDYEFARKNNGQTYETQIYDMLCSFKIYTRVYHAYLSGGGVSESLLKDFDESIVTLKKHDMNSIYKFYIAFLEADYHYFQHEYSTSIERYEKIRKTIRDCNVFGVPSTSISYEQVNTLIDSSIGWMVYLSNPGKPEVALKYFETIDNPDVYEYPFLSRHYRNRAVLLEKLNKTTEAKAAYEESKKFIREHSVDIKTLHAYSSFIMKQWDIVTKKATKGGWSKNENYDGINKEYHDVETCLMLAKDLSSGDAGIYLLYSKMFSYKTLMMLWNNEPVYEIDRKLKEAFLYLRISQKLLPHEKQATSRTLYVERDLYYVKFLINHDKESIEKAIEFNGEILALSPNNDEAKKMKEIFAPYLKLKALI